MASALQPTNSKSGKPVTEKKKRKRPSKKVPTTVLESSSTNFMDLVQKLTGSAAELASDKTTEDKRPKSSHASPVTCPVLEPSSSYFQDYLRNATYNDNDSSSSSQQGSAAFHFPNFLTTMDPTSGYNFSGEALEDELYQSGYTGGPSNSSSSRAVENDTSLFSSSWREPSSHPDYWYTQMDAMRA